MTGSVRAAPRAAALTHTLLYSDHEPAGAGKRRPHYSAKQFIFLKHLIFPFLHAGPARANPDLYAACVGENAAPVQSVRASVSPAIISKRRRVQRPARAGAR